MDAVFNTALLSFHKKKIRHEILFILYLILYRYFDAEIFSSSNIVATKHAEIPRTLQEAVATIHVG